MQGSALIALFLTPPTPETQPSPRLNNQCMLMPRSNRAAYPLLKYTDPLRERWLAGVGGGAGAHTRRAWRVVHEGAGGRGARRGRVERAAPGPGTR
jgi:hypothetical protein